MDSLKYDHPEENILIIGSYLAERAVQDVRGVREVAAETTHVDERGTMKAVNLSYFVFQSLARFLY